MFRISGHNAVPFSEIQLTYVKSGGPGGQHVNKTSTAVHLRFDILNSSLEQKYKDRLMVLNDKRISKAGIIIIKAQEARSQKQNREMALNRFKVLIRRVMTTRNIRIKTSPPKTAHIKRLDAKSRRGELKKLRQKIDVPS